MAQLKHRTGITPNIMGRFAICLSFNDPSTPNPDEYDEKGSEIHPSVLFGEHEDMFMALMIMRLKKENLDPDKYLNRMLRAHFNRGTIMLFSRVHSLTDIPTMIELERKR